MDKIIDLLTVLSQSLKENNNRSVSGDSFNIFNVLGVQSKEVILCRFIGELLDPNGNHDLGAIPLKRFFEIVLNEKITESQALDAKVKLEDLIDKQRRVDIAVFIGNKVYPIEAKVWAGDQNAQLYDYYNYYKKDKEISKIYYLTPTGKNPSEESVVTLTSDKVQCLSFEKDILNWIKALEPADECNLKSACKQFEEVITNMIVENVNLQRIVEVLDIENVDNYSSNDKLKSAIALLNQKDELTRVIMQSYLMNKIYIGNHEGCVISLVDKNERNALNHSLLKIVNENTNQILAWICVASNLYIAAEKIKSDAVTSWTNEGDKYYWHHICPDGGRTPFPLKKLECIFEYDNKIDISRYLDDVVL